MGKKSKPSRRKPQIKIDKRGKDYNPFPAPISQEKFKHPAANPLDSFTGEYNSDEEKKAPHEGAKEAVNENHVEQFMQSFTAVTDSLSAAQDSEGQQQQATSAVWHEVLDTNTNCIYYWNQQDNITSWVLPTDATVVRMQSSTTDTSVDQMDGVTTEADTAATEEGTTDVTSSEELVEYGPQLPDNYVPPSNEQASTTSDVSSRKRPATDDENPQDIDSMLDDALEVKRVRLEEGVDSMAGIHGNTVLSAEQLSAEISEKLRVLNASKLGVSPLQLVLIQYETRISDYNNGAISEMYLMEKLQEATQALDMYAVSVAPAGWMCYWNGDAKRYCFHNQESGEYTWEYPTPQIASRTGAKSLQQLQDVTNEGHSTPSEAVEVTEPIQGPLPLERQEVAIPTNTEATPTTADVISEDENVPNLYSPQAPPTDDIADVPSSGDVAVNDNVDVNTGDRHHDNTDDKIVAEPITSLATPSGNITDSDEDIMEALPDASLKDEDTVEQHMCDDDDEWVVVERPSVTSDDQSLDSLTEDCMEVTDPMGSCDPASSLLGVQEVIAHSSDNVSSLEHEQCVVTTSSTVVTSSLLPMDTANQDAGGSVADDEAEEDEMDDWWRSKGPSTTKSSTSTAQQPKWNSLKFTRQLKTRWGVPSSSAVTTTTAKETQPTTVTSTKTGNLLAWFPEEEEKKELALPTAEEIAETKEREEQLAAAAAAKKEREKEKLLAKMEEAAARRASESSETEAQSSSQDNEQQQDQPTSGNDDATVTITTVSTEVAPVTTTEQPAQQPVTETQQPVTKVQQPVTKAQQPVTETKQPVTETKQPVTETKQPVTETKQPVTETQQPVTETQQPVSEQQAQQPVTKPLTTEVQQQPKETKTKTDDDSEDDGSSSSDTDSSSSSSSGSSSSSFTLSSGDSSSSSDEEEEEEDGKKTSAADVKKVNKEVKEKERSVTEGSSTVRTDDVKEQPPLEDASEVSHQQQEEQPISTENQQPLPSEEPSTDDSKHPQVSTQGEAPDVSKQPVEQDEAMEIEASPEQDNDVTKMEEEVTEAPVKQDVSESLKEVEKVNISEQPLPSVEQPLPSSVGQPLPSVEQPLPSKQGLSDISTMPTATTKSSQSTKPVTVAREESPPPPPPPSTTGAVAMATNSPHYASTSTSYSQSPSGAPAPGSEGYSAYLQAYAYYAAHAQAQAAQYYANYPQAAAYARMYQAYSNPYGNTSSYGNQYDSTSYYNYAARAYAAQAQNYSNSSGGHQSEDDSARSDKSKRK